MSTITQAPAPPTLDPASIASLNAALANLPKDSLVNPEDILALAATAAQMGTDFSALIGKPIYICSIYPKRIVSQWFSIGLNGGRRRFVLDPTAKKEGYDVIVVTDATTLTMDINPPDDNTEPGQIRRTVLASAIARDLIQHFCGDTGLYLPGQRSIGVGQIAGPVPTEAELSHLRALQAEHDRALVQQAGEFWANPMERRRIHAEHYAALERLGLSDQSSNYPWYVRITPVQVEACLFCGQNVDVRVVGCKECGTDNARYAIENGITDLVPARWEAVQKRIQHLTKQTALAGKETKPSPAASK